MIQLILDYIGPLGQLLGGIAAFITALIGLHLWIRKWLNRTREEISQATSAHMQRLIGEQLTAAAAAADPANYYTLDVHFQNGLSMMVPMFPFREMIVSENIRMAVIDHTPEATTLLLRCRGMGTLPRHFHATTCETIEVRSGRVTHLETGVRYGPGETWVIPQGATHSAFFENCCLIITHRPPLPTGAVRPADLSAMPAVFPEI